MIEFTTISRSNAGDWILDNNNCLIQVGHDCHIYNDLGQNIIRSNQKDYLKVEPPPPIQEHRKYQISIIPSSYSLNSRHPCILPKYVQLVDSNFYGARKRFEICDYAVDIPFLFATTDPRHPTSVAIWSIGSGQFFDLIKNKKNNGTCYFKYDIDRVPYLHIDFPDGKRIKVPGQ
jgi:hypothetical protein